MADKTINELVEATQILQQDLFVLQQENTAKKLSGQTLITFLLRMIDGHGGVRSYQKVSTSGLVDTYRFTFADESTLDIPVTNGRAITSVNQTAVNGLTRTYTIAFNDNTSQAFTVTDGRSITKIEKTRTDGLTDTFTIYYNDGTTSTFVVMNGRGIQLFEKVSTSGLKHTYRFSFNDGTSNEFTVTDGEKGDKGDNTYTHIKFASQQPTDNSHSMGDIPDNWIGMYWGPVENPPTDWKQYKWFKIKGEKGDTGDPATLLSYKVEYQVSDSGTIIPSGSWQTSVPVVAQGKYLWTRTTNTFNTGNPVVSYSVSRMGLDGSGSVVSVANISPDENGNVPLSAADVNALPNMGGDLLGELKMNGQPISGLNPPTENTQAANMGYVIAQVKKAAPRNLLDNSDFRNPVNQRGKLRYVGKDGDRYSIDRWNIESQYAIMDIGENGITLTADAQYGWDVFPYQLIPVTPSMRGKRFTAAVCLGNDEVCIFANGVLPKDNPAVDTLIGYTYFHEKAQFSLYARPDNTMMVQIKVLAGQSIPLEWAALYEGEYTKDTLPEYQPKGYAVELAECMRYYQVLPFKMMTATSQSTLLPSREFKVPMRAIPTVVTIFTYAGDGYVATWGNDTAFTVRVAIAKQDGLDYVTVNEPTQAGQPIAYGVKLSADL